MKAYIDPYIDKRTGLLKNKLGIIDAEELHKAEADLTGLSIKEISLNPVEGKFDFSHLCKIHEAIFKDLYEWAGSPRIINIEKSEEALGGLSVEYTECDNIQKESSIILSELNNVDWDKLSLDKKSVELSNYMADLWKVHPFREGNTRTTITFFCDFAKYKGFGLNRDLFKDNSEYTRRALVAASAKFIQLGDLSKPEFLRKIVKDSMVQWEVEHQKNTDEKGTMSEWKKEISRERKKDSHKPSSEKVHKNIKER